MKENIILEIENIQHESLYFKLKTFLNFKNL